MRMAANSPPQLAPPITDDDDNDDDDDGLTLGLLIDNQASPPASRKPSWTKQKQEGSIKALFLYKLPSQPNYAKSPRTEIRQAIRSVSRRARPTPGSGSCAATLAAPLPPRAPCIHRRAYAATSQPRLSQKEQPSLAKLGQERKLLEAWKWSRPASRRRLQAGGRDPEGAHERPGYTARPPPGSHPSLG